MKCGHQNKDEDREGGVVEQAGPDSQAGRDFGVVEIDDDGAAEKGEHGDGDNTDPETHPKIEVGEAENISEKPGFEVLIGTDKLKDHDADSKGSGVEDRENGVIADFCDAGKEDGENADDDGCDDGSEEGAEHSEAENPSRDGDAREKAVAQSGELERTPVKENEGTGVAIDKADDERGKNGPLIEGKFKELGHARGGGRNEGFA